MITVILDSFWQSNMVWGDESRSLRRELGLLFMLSIGMLSRKRLPDTFHMITVIPTKLYFYEPRVALQSGMSKVESLFFLSEQSFIDNCARLRPISSERDAFVGLSFGTSTVDSINGNGGKRVVIYWPPTWVVGFSHRGCELQSVLVMGMLLSPSRLIRSKSKPARLFLRFLVVLFLLSLSIQGAYGATRWVMKDGNIQEVQTVHHKILKADARGENFVHDEDSEVKKLSQDAIFDSLFGVSSQSQPSPLPSADDAMDIENAELGSCEGGELVKGCYTLRGDDELSSSADMEVAKKSSVAYTHSWASNREELLTELMGQTMKELALTCSFHFCVSAFILFTCANASVIPIMLLTLLIYPHCTPEAILLLCTHSLFVELSFHLCCKQWKLYKRKWTLLRPLAVPRRLASYLV
jgi:hypothetical protein